ncbi:MAG: diacylglycerol kinase [Alphaproteobacteria bacterium]|nr:diacylglycerol kinase [Alphaproteobacteria bacterium]MBN2779452.1 diacylglycerol kinase [Alphaproteobacteria bacterium]
MHNLWNAFLNSTAGLVSAFKEERAFRQECYMALVLIPLAFFIVPSCLKRYLLVSSVLLVLIVELLNTGIEMTVDRISKAKHPLSKKAKDVGSAAVLISLLFMVMTWAFVLL